MKSSFIRPVFIQNAFRSAIARFGGSFAKMSAGELAASTLKRGVKNKDVDFVFMGHARQAGNGPNTARQAAIGAGLSQSIPAWTLNQACASGLCAVGTGVDQIQLGRSDSILAGGVEAMSRTPYMAMEARWGRRLGNLPLVDGMYQDGFYCPMAEMLMGETAELLAKEYSISRAEQDAWALDSQQKAEKAQKEGRFQNEIVPVHNSKEDISQDEHPRAGNTLEKLAKLPPVFDPIHGTISAGNASGITDGAAWLELSSRKESTSLAEILDFEITGCDPKRMGLGPVQATRKLLERQGLKIGDVDLIEINEAFAAQVLACQKDLKFKTKQCNPFGGAIALGHPIGATGARIVVTLCHALQSLDKEIGLATLCVSGGQGYSMLIRRL